ncbi:MAG: SIMPL domain-containing protein [Bacteroidaceae bacterium]|nr:SIMPL domain-containing protein [Bacteroidaceae bacterium]
MKSYYKEAGIIAFGLIFLGVCICYGLTTAFGSKRIVSVKGLAEREVEANLVIWPLNYEELGNDLSDLYQECNHKNRLIVQFLKSNGIQEKEITVKAPQVNDMSANQYSSNNSGYRYHVQSCVTVASNNVQQVRKLILRQSELLNQGIAVKGDEYATVYEFTDLNKIKPEMIEEATKNARSAGEKFAQDSESELGKIKQASQGQFSIEDRDSDTPHIKKVRVVTNIDFYLE